MKRLLTVALLIMAQMSYAAERVPAFFEELRSGRVESSEMVEWQQVGPGMSGYCEEFWCHPTNVDVMFMSPDMYNSYGTWDGGKSWQTIKDCDGTGQDVKRVQAITFSHQNPKSGLAITVTGALYRTTDMGHTWQLTDFKSEGRCSELVVDPTDDKIWYMGAGDYWNVKFNHRTLASLNDPYKGYYGLYVAYGHINKSTDGGRTWRKITKGLPPIKEIKLANGRKVKAGVEVGTIVVDPTDNKNVIAQTNFGIYRSTDQGESWSPSGEGLPSNRARDMDYYYNAKSREFILYALEQTNLIPDGNTIKSTGGVYKSTDHGASWQSIAGNLAVDMAKITEYSYINKYYMALSQWLGLDSKTVRTKYNVRPMALYSGFNRLVVNPKNKDEVYISDNTKMAWGFVPGDIWKTADGGKSWVAASRFSRYWNEGKDNAYWESRGNDVDPNVTFGHIGPDMDRWDEMRGNRFLEINIRGEVFACFDQQTMRSSDGGKSWQQIDDYETAPGSGCWIGRGDSNLPGRFMLLDTGVKGRHIFCSGEHGLWMSAPLGRWRDKDAVAVRQIEGQKNHQGSTSPSTVAVDPKEPNTIYTLQIRQSNRGKFRVSYDAGETWETLSDPLPFDGNISSENFVQNSLLVDYKNSNNIYFTVTRNPISDVGACQFPKGYPTHSVMKSSDKGKSWKMMNKGLPEDVSVRRLAMDLKSPNILYAACNESVEGNAGGLFMTRDGAESWQRVKTPAGVTSVNNIFIDKTTEALYISCGTATSGYDAGGVWRSKDGGKKWEKIFHLPYVWQCESSPLDPDILVVSAPLQHLVKGVQRYNPGAYLSLDGGKSWAKINRNLGQPDKIVDIKPDTEDRDKLWCALIGSGWTVAKIKR